MKVNGISEDIVNKLQTKDSEEEVNEAVAENILMEQGNDIPGLPGRSDQHKMMHTMKLLELYTDRDAAARELMEIEGSVNPQMMGEREVMQIATQADRIGEQLESMEEVIQRIVRHLEVDNTPKMAADEMAISMGQPPQPAPPMEGPQAGPMGPEGMPPEAMMQGIGPDQAGGMPGPGGI